MSDSFAQDAAMFKALSDERRLKILDLLKSGEECACNLGEELDLPQSSLSYHMKILCESGIVTGRKDGKWMHYRINIDGCQVASKVLEKLADPPKTPKKIKTSNC